MSSRINRTWHLAHPMPKNATLEQRIRWHVAHSRACACREMPVSIRAELKRRREATLVKRRGGR